MGCELVKIPPTYIKQIPPRNPISHGGSGIVEIDVNSIIFNIIDIDENQSTFKLSFGLELRWKDRYLTYNFLTNLPQKNVVTKEMQEQIWIPKLHFLLLLQKDNLFEAARILFVEKKGLPLMENEIFESYSGTENWFTLETINQATFICSFDNIKSYPFGTQKCSFKLFIPGVDNSYTKLSSKSFVDDGPKSVGEYQIVQWTIQIGPVLSQNQEKFKSNYSKTENNIGLIYTVHLSRKISNIILVTYLPTLLMNLLNQATNYISSEDKYELIITVNITCMMVLASIYLSVSTSLPTTAEIKPVEVWLLFSLIYPVLLTVLNILLQVSIKFRFYF